MWNYIRRIFCRRTRKNFLLAVVALLITVHFLIGYSAYISRIIRTKKNTNHIELDVKLPIYSRTKHEFALQTPRNNRTTPQHVLLNMTQVTEREDKEKECEVPEILYDGVPWPNCIGKIQWMKMGWKNDPCYAANGVSSDICSIIKFLSERERHCPQTSRKEVKLEPLYLKGAHVSTRTNFDYLFKELGSVDDYAWIKSRITQMQNLWMQAAKDVYSEESRPRMKKRILLHLGLMKLGLGKEAGKGGPLGELVQWSDLIASLYIVGHDIVIIRNKGEISFVFKDYMNQITSNCPTSPENIPFDIIYTDINGYNDIKTVVKNNKFDSLRCRMRIVDSFGTEADFNDADYRNKKKKKKSVYNGLNLNLKQFNTMFPHTPDNTFLGFVTEFLIKNATNSEEKRNIALVYGKVENFWKGKEKYIDIIKEYVSEVHATVDNPKNLSTYIINHGVLPANELFQLLRRTKFFVGLGFPFEGPAPLEAIQAGAVFINPRFDVPISSENHEFYRIKPTSRKITSQNPYAEKYIGKPHVYTINIENEMDLRKCLQEIIDTPEPGGYLSHEFSARGMIERVGTLVEKQQFCTQIPYSTMPQSETRRLWWPPLSALKLAITESSKRQSCNDVCEKDGLICEPSFFPVLNRKEAFEQLEVSLPCKDVIIPGDCELDYPAYDPKTQACYLQRNPILFSCAGNYVNLQRLCPCRDFIRGQTAFCRDCRTGR